MTHLRQAMLDELQRRNCATATVRYDIQAVERFAEHFHRPPDRLTEAHLREYQAYLLRDRKLEPRTVKLHVSALRFLFVKTLKRRSLLDDIPYPKVPRRLPTILTVEEVTRLIDAARTLTDRTMLMVPYSTGMRNAELRRPAGQEHRQSVDADSHRARQGRSRSVRPAQCDAAGDAAGVLALDEAEDTAVPGTIAGWRADKPITPKVVWDACQSAATRAQIEKRVSAYLLRHSYATHLLEAGADLRTIQLLLGHVTLEHTVIYLHLSRRHLHAVTNPLDMMPVSAPTRRVARVDCRSGDPATRRGGRHHSPIRDTLHRGSSRLADGAAPPRASRAAAGRVRPCRLHPPTRTCRTRAAEQAGGVRPPLPG